MESGGVYLSKNDQFKLMCIQEYREGSRSLEEIALTLGVHVKTAGRWVKQVAAHGVQGLVHGNKGKRPTIAKDEEFKRTVIKLVKERYYDCNIAHCRDLLEQEHGLKVAYSTLHLWCSKEGVYRRKRRRPSKARMQRERLSNEGLMVQFDGSKHAWNGQEDWVLIAGIDDASSEIPYAEFFTVENTWNCMKVLKEIIKRKGIPVSLYTDKAGWLAGGKRQEFTQFVRACEELGITVIPANSPQAKGRIERAWDTLQSRLIPELRLAGITTMPAANQYLNETFLPKYWNIRNTVVPKNEISRYQKIPEWLNLEETLCWKYDRHVRHDTTFSFAGSLWKITGGVIGSFRRKQIKIHLYEDGSFCAFYGHFRLATVEVVKSRRKWRSAV